MKRKGIAFPLIVSALLGGVVLSSCGNNEEQQEKEKEVVLNKIQVSNPKTEYSFGEAFVKPTVQALYSDGSSKQITENLTFSGFNSQTSGDQIIIVTYSENGKTYSTTYKVTVSMNINVLTDIKIEDSTKKVYEYGESFVKPVVTAIYKDATTKDVSNLCQLTHEFDSTRSGSYEIIVSYTEQSVTKTAKYTATVNPPAVFPQKIEVSGSYKTEYELDEELVKPTIIATYSNSTTKDVTSEVNFIYDFSTAGDKTVQVKYEVDGLKLETSFNVTVKASVSTKLKFAVFADVQLCAAEAGEGKAANLGETANAPLALEQHLRYIKSQGIDVVLMDGDVTNQANEHYYAYFESIVEKVYGSDKSLWPEFVWNMGNHEWWAGTTEDDPRTGGPGDYTLPAGAINSVGLFNEHARIDSENLVKRSAIKYASNVEDTLPSYYKVINGVPFLVISAVNSSGLITDELKAEINAWLEEIKALDSVKAGGPIFVQYHYPLATSMTHGQGSKETNTATIDDIFGNIPNAIIFTGDTHFPGNNERSINQVNYTTINLGTSSYSRMVDQSAVICDNYENVTGGHKEAGKGEIAQGNVGYKNAYTPNIQIVEVLSNNTTKINRFMSEEGGTARKVGEQWTIKPTTSKDTFEYTNARFQNKDAALKLYGEKGVSWDESDELIFEVNETEKQMTVHFNDPKEYHFVEHYDVKVNGVSHDFVSNYYKYLKTPEENYFVIENLPEAASYEVEVTAYDFFDNPSLNKLTSSTDTAGKAIDPIDLYFADGNYNYSDIETRNNFEYTAEDSNSSSEFYYKGIQTYNAGAILGRLIEKDKLKISNYLSVEPGEGSKPVVTFDVKNLKDDDLVFGLSVVTTGNTWKTDFGSEYQKTVSGKEWTTLTWDLNDLFGITSKESLENITIKAKSKEASSSGYEMNFLVDNVDIVNGGDTPIPPTPPTPTERGDAFTAKDGLVKDFDSISTTDGQFVMDIKPTTGTDKKVCFGLFDADWSNRVGWFDVQMDGSPVCDGITVRSTNDGYLRVTVDFAKLPANKFEPGHATEVSHLQLHNTVEEGSWTTASGYCDVFPTQGEVVRGQRFQNATDLTLDLPEQIELTDTIKVDVKFDNPVKSNKVAIMLGQGWNQYFGYFDILGDGTLGSPYDGVSIVNLDDGYIRVTFNISELTKLADKPAPDQYIDMIYIRGVWSVGDGYIDINSNEGHPVRGETYTAGEHFDRNIGDLPLTESFTFDVRFLSGEDTHINVMLGDGWSNYFGYYKINSNGTLAKAYDGVSIHSVGDGYYRVTFSLGLLNEKNEDTVLPTEKVNLFYIRGEDWSNANCYIDLNPGK